MPPKGAEKIPKKASTTRLGKEKQNLNQPAGKEKQNINQPPIEIDESDNEADNEDEPTTATGGRRRSQVSIAESPLPGGEHPDELRPRLTPRGRRSDRDDNTNQAKLPAPADDIFKSSFWPSLPIGTTSLESQITNAKLDMMMAYLQDIRASQVVTTRYVPRNTSKGDSVPSSRARRASLPKEFVKFDIPAEEIDTLTVEAEAATKSDDAFTQPAIRLYIIDNPKDSAYTKNIKGCQDAGIRFRDKMLELGVNFRKADRDDIAKWDPKDAGKFFLDCLKERRRIYNRENAQASDNEEEEQQAGSNAGNQGDESLFLPEEGDNSEPVREATGHKSTAKLSGSASSKRQKSLPTIADDESFDETEENAPATGSSSSALPLRGGRQTSTSRASSSARGRGKGK